MLSIEYINHSNIDYQQWDNCIKRSFNGSIQAYSWYLNIFCGHWDALIEIDYKSVMPLPIKRKWGKNIVYMPPFISQLGIYSSESLTVQKTVDFFTMLKQRFQFVNLYLNKFTPIPEGLHTAYSETHFEIDLIRPYLKIVNEYSLEIKNKLHLATARQYSIIRGLSPNDLISFLKKEKTILHPDIRKNDYKLLRMLIASVIRYKTGELYGAYNKFNMLSCVSLFVWSNNKVILLFSVATDEALADNAHLLLYDQFIEKNSETSTTMCYEYKDSAHTAAIYLGFGAKESHLQQILINRMPFYLKPFISA